MLSHSSTLSIRATTRSDTPMRSSIGEQQSKEARTSSTTTPGFTTPISFVSKHDTSEDLGYSPRKKLRRTSSTHHEHLARSSGREPTVANLRSPASILARLDLSHVPKNEFFLAIPSQLNSNSNWGVEYARPIMRRSDAFSSKSDASANSSTGSLNSPLFISPASSRLNRAMTTRSVFLPILDLDLDEDFLQKDTSNVCGFRLKPRARKLMINPKTLPWDQECTF
jgi:hypothetical protein